MDIYLSDQRKNFKKHLDLLKNREVMEYDKSKLVKKVATIDMVTHKKFDELNLDFLFDYQVFPDIIMSYMTQWSEENRKMKIGDTIMQQVFIPPIKKWSQKIVFGVRVNEIIDQVNKRGFSYETLEGHVERGISTFTIEQMEDKLIFKIQTYSKPGNMLATLIGPVFSIPYQAFCTKKALKNVKRQIEMKGI